MDEKLMSSADKAIKNVDKLGGVELVFVYTALSKIIGINAERVTTLEQLRREINSTYVPLNKTKFRQYITDLYSNGVLDINPTNLKLKFLLHDLDDVPAETKRDWPFGE